MMFRRLLLLSLLLLPLGCSGPDGDDAAVGSAARGVQAASGFDAAAVELNNRAVGLMGRFDYAAAVPLFAQLAADYPQSANARVNLAIATLNRQQDGDEQAALEMLDRLLERQPGELRAQYVAGLLRLYLDTPQQALGHFQAVVDADPDDPFAAYYLAQCLFQLGDGEQALRWYRRAISLDPYLRSAYYGAFQALRRGGEREPARAMLGDYQRLAENPRARLAEFKYSRMGSKAEVLAFAGADTPAWAPPPAGELFAEPQLLPLLQARIDPRRRVSISRADPGGDGQPLLLLTGVGDDELPNRVFSLTASGALEPVKHHPLGRVSAVNAALWGDYDNDGLTDVYLLRSGPNQLWRQHPAGQWRDVSSDTDTGNGDHDSVDGLFVDADHDGDLDLLVVNADGANELLNNDRNGRFRAIAAAQGIAAAEPSRQALAADLDGDRDLDLIVINREPPHRVYANDRLWAYHPASGFDEFVTAAIDAAVIGDVDGDGRREIYSASGGQLLRWQRDGDQVWRATELGAVAALDGAEPQLALADVDGDGVLELIAGSGAGWAALRLGDAGIDTVAGGQGRFAGWRSLLLQPDKGPQVLAVGSDGDTRLWPAGPGRWPYLLLALSGMDDPGQAMRSNASGIGAAVALRTGSRWTLVDTLPANSAPGQDLAPLALGLAGAAVADFVSIDWSDGVFQSELALPPGTLQPVTETQRQLSSCPLLFAWDGARYRFVSDLLGVGGIGYAIGAGEYAEPRPWENFLFPAGLLQPRDGVYEIKIAEPMEEVAYLDAARLVAWDLPPGWQLVLDERMGINDPQPTGQPRFYRRERLPSRVLDASGAEVTAALREVDARAPAVGPLDLRFVGRLAAEQVLTLSFDQPLDAGPGEPLLMIDGWVEYPYSQTQFAAWQAGASFDAPTLEARGSDGVWRQLLPEFGYPAGMPRRMSVPLIGLPAGATELRLRTNMEVYWDRIAVVWAEEPAAVRRQSAALVGAELAQIGFPRRSTAAQRYPDYDYDRRSPLWDVNYQRGWYTRPGAVEELVGRHDDAVALIGPGDEVQLRFQPPAKALAAGWSRYWVLETNGWAKDRDLFTRDGETVAPLPSSGQPREPADRLHARYNTRYQDGR